MTLEISIQHEILLALSQEPDVTLWRNNTGVADFAVRREDLRRWVRHLIVGQYRPVLDEVQAALRAPGRVRYGLAPGSSDLVGIGPRGRFLALEVKQPGKKPTEEQERFIAIVRAAGGVAEVVTSVERAQAVVKQMREEHPR